MKTRYVVSCPKHGVESKDWAGRQVVVPRPENKKQQFAAGCPHCKKEARAAAAAQPQPIDNPSDGI